LWARLFTIEARFAVRGGRSECDEISDGNSAASRENAHLPTDALSSAEMDVEIAPLVLKVGASSIAEFEKLLGELQEAKNFLQSDGERVQRETAQYICSRSFSLGNDHFGFGARMARSRPFPLGTG
jgi:hypothetical protein